jgi:hypothetical protein
LTAFGWLPKLREIIPSYGVSLIEDAKLLRSVRAETARVLKVENIEFFRRRRRFATCGTKKSLSLRMEKSTYG